MNANPAYESYDAQRVWRDFPILAREVHGRPLVFLDSAASSQRPASVIAAVDAYTTAYAVAHAAGKAEGAKEVQKRMCDALGLI